MLQDAQFGRLYPFTDYHKLLLFCDLPLSPKKWPTGWSTITPKFHTIPYNCNPLYNISFTSNKTGFPLKDCGNDDGGVRE